MISGVGSRAGFVRLRNAGVPDTRATRGHSSVGRALEWHSRGRGFDSPWLHQQKTPYSNSFRKSLEGRGVQKFPDLRDVARQCYARLVARII
jgi:hypothetical protein